jgi:predicted nuclease of predicted toxin-antitoxin system
MLRFVADNDFNERIIRGLLRRRPQLDLVHVRDVGLRTASDPDILAWAAKENRIVLSHDHQSMPDHAYDRVRAGQPMPGVFLTPQQSHFGPVIDDIVLIDELSEPNEWKDRVVRLPLRAS